MVTRSATASPIFTTPFASAIPNRCLTSSSTTRFALSQLCVPKRTPIFGVCLPASTSRRTASTRVRTHVLYRASVSDFSVHTGGTGSGDMEGEYDVPNPEGIADLSAEAAVAGCAATSWGWYAPRTSFTPSEYPPSRAAAMLCARYSGVLRP